MKLSPEAIDTAIEFLLKNASFKIEDLVFEMEEVENYIRIIGYLQYWQSINLNKRIVVEEIKEIKNEFARMIESSEKLRNFIADKQIKYCLVLSHGNGGELICYEKKGEIIWNMQVKD